MFTQTVAGVVTLVVIILGLGGCASLPTSVKVSNHTFYYLKQASDDDYVTVMHFLTKDVSHLSKTDWENLITLPEKPLCMELSDWSNINTTFSAFCSSPHVNCNYEVAPGVTFKQAMNNLFINLAGASGRKFAPVE